MGYEVTEFLEDIVSQEFNLVIDDSSIVAKIQTLPRCDLSLCKVENDEGEMEDVEENHEEENVVKQVEEMDIHNACKAEETDADGFTIVSRKKEEMIMSLFFMF